MTLPKIPKYNTTRCANIYITQTYCYKYYKKPIQDCLFLHEGFLVKHHAIQSAPQTPRRFGALLETGLEFFLPLARIEPRFHKRVDRSHGILYSVFFCEGFRDALAVRTNTTTTTVNARFHGISQLRLGRLAE